MFQYVMSDINLIHLSKVRVNSIKKKISYFWDGRLDTKTFANTSDFDDAVAAVEDAGFLMIGDTYFNTDRLSIAIQKGKAVTYHFLGDVTITHIYDDVAGAEEAIEFIEPGFILINGKWYQGKQIHIARLHPTSFTIEYDYLGETDNFKVQYADQSEYDDAVDKLTTIGEGGGSSSNRVKTPKIVPSSGTVESGTEVTITCKTEGAKIHYTTDGTDPDATSPVYSSVITINRTTTVKAIAIKAGMDNSKIATANYHVDIPSVANPVFSPNGGAVDSGTEVTITCATAGAKIYYTTDGSTPDASSTEYTAPIEVTAAVTIKAIGIADDMADSDVVTKAFTIKLYKFAGVYNNPDEDTDIEPVESDITPEWLEALTDVVKQAATAKEYGGMGDEKDFPGFNEDTGGRAIYAYPASLGDITSYIQNSSVQAIGNSFDKLTPTVNGVLYNVYVLRNAVAPTGGSLHWAFV